MVTTNKNLAECTECNPSALDRARTSRCLGLLFLRLKKKKKKVESNLGIDQRHNASTVLALSSSSSPSAPEEGGGGDDLPCAWALG
jgi:hypothetical protein